MTIGRDAGVGLASLLFWHGVDGYKRETSETLRFFFSRSATFVDVGANCGIYSLLAPSGILISMSLHSNPFGQYMTV